MLDDILINQGRPKTTISQFNRFFADYDKNGDGVISRKEVTAFVKKFLGVPEDDKIEQLVQKIF
jgi:Ca2+-binding EF-hand superfamily protein